MLADQRREEIVELLRENGSCRVTELAKTFNMTEQTIRQDLETLEKLNVVKRQHGGASISNYSSFAGSIQLERRTHMEEKQKIGEVAASYVKSGDSLILDSGTTVTEMAKHLVNLKNLKIVTPSLNLTLILGKEPTNSIVMTGGEFKAPTLSLTGIQAAAIFDNLYVEKLFLATGGFSLNSGLSYPSFSDIPLKKAMIESAKTVYLLADSSKLELLQFASLGYTGNIKYLITDDKVQPEYVKKLQEVGITTIIAS